MSYGSLDDLDQIDDLLEVEETDFGGEYSMIPICENHTCSSWTNAHYSDQLGIQDVLLLLFLDTKFSCFQYEISE